MHIPQLILRQLYTFGSLERVADGVRFGLKNRLSDATLTRVAKIALDGVPVSLDLVRIDGGGEPLRGSDVSTATPMAFPLKKTIHVEIAGVTLEKGKHKITLAFDSQPFGELSFSVEDAVSDEAQKKPTTIPYDKENELLGGSDCGAAGVHHVLRGRRPPAHRQVLRSTRRRRAATSRTSPAWRRCRSASPGRSRSTASTPRASS